MQDYRYLYGDMLKDAAAILTPEAEQAAMQAPPMPMGAPAGAPMDPAMMGGQPPMDPAMAGGQPAVTGPAGGQIPPEILQDQVFVQFLAQTMGIQLDMASGMFVGPDGQPVPAQLIVQAYQEFQMQMQQAQQTGMAPAEQGGAPMDPAMMGGQPPMDPAMMAGQPAMDPAMMEGQPPMDPNMMAGGMSPEQMAGPVPQGDMAMTGQDMMPPAGQEAAINLQDELINQIAGAVMSGIESVLQDMVASQEKKISALLDKVDMLKNEIASLRDTTDKRTQAEDEAEKQLREELSADLNPVAKQAANIPAPQPISMPTATKVATVTNLFSVISGVR